MENLFLITGILYFVTQTVYLAFATWRDIETLKNLREAMTKTGRKG
jgi:hypothetical protein